MNQKVTMKLLKFSPLFAVLVTIIGAIANQASGSYQPSMATLRKTTRSMIYSEVLPGNLLPGFMFMQDKVESGQSVKIGGGKGTTKPFIPDDSCDHEIFQDANPDLRSPQLPYLTQDQWTCERVERDDVEVYELENEYLRVRISPQSGGKVSGIYDKKRQIDLIYDNPFHQPANIGALHAWVSGGAEWNWSPGIIGHSAFTETQVYFAEIHTERGPLLRVYEFDRYNSTTWQVDMLLEDDIFYVHPRITNPTDCDLRGYWWTCVAVQTTQNTRIFAPAGHVVETSRLTAANAPWPYYAEAIENASFVGREGRWPTDNSWIANHPSSGDLFLRIPNTTYTPFIGHAEVPPLTGNILSNGNFDDSKREDEDDKGWVFIHGHQLNGTKFFTWGNSGPGRYMQDFLAAGRYRQGDYTELQVGPAPTQMQTFGLSKNSKMQWTEWFTPFGASNRLLASPHYSRVIDDLTKEIQRKVPKNVLQSINDFFEVHASIEPDIIHVQGQPWGALEELRLGKSLAKGLTFGLPADESLSTYKEMKPWLELVQDGKFSEQTLSQLPLSYQTTDGWRDLIQKSADSFGMTWLHALHLGICSAERGGLSEPRQYFNMSMEMKPTVVAARCLAVLSSNTNDAWANYQVRMYFRL